MSQEAAGTGRFFRGSDGRVVVETHAEIGIRQLVVIKVRIDSQPLEHRLRNRFEQRFVGRRQLSKNRFIADVGPEVFGAEFATAFLGHVECTTTPDPSLDKVRVDFAGFLYREVPLAHRAVPPGAKTHFVFQGRRREQRFRLFIHLIVKRWIDAVVNQYRESDLLDGGAEFLGERLPVILIAVQITTEIERLDFIVRIEFICVALGKSICVALLNLVVSNEVLVDCLNVRIVHMLFRFPAR